MFNFQKLILIIFVSYNINYLSCPGLHDLWWISRGRGKNVLPQFLHSKRLFVLKSSNAWAFNFSIASWKTLFFRKILKGENWKCLLVSLCPWDFHQQLCHIRKVSKVEVSSVSWVIFVARCSISFHIAEDVLLWKQNRTPVRRCSTLHLFSKAWLVTDWLWN